MQTGSVGSDGTGCVRRGAWGSVSPCVRTMGGVALLALILLLSATGAKADIYNFTLTAPDQTSAPGGLTGTGSVTVVPGDCSGGLCELPADSLLPNTGLADFTFTFDGQTFTPSNTCNNEFSCGGGSGSEVNLYLPPMPVVEANLQLTPSGETYQLTLLTNGTFSFDYFDEPSTVVTGTYTQTATPEPSEVIPGVAILGFLLSCRKLLGGGSSRKTQAAPPGR